MYKTASSVISNLITCLSALIDRFQMCAVWVGGLRDFIYILLKQEAVAREEESPVVTEVIYNSNTALQI